MEKGSVCIDGVSLTVVSVTDTEFSVSLIPHTSGHTTLSEKKAGSVVNLETDVIAKYIMKLTVPYEKKGGSLSLQTLLENGFLNFYIKGDILWHRLKKGNYSEQVLK